MAHVEQNEFIQSVKNHYPQYFNGVKVLEVGSLDLNGTVRGSFTNCDYTGLDVGPGPGVDIVCSGHVYDAPDNTFDTVISCESFEHNPEWVSTFINMWRMCKHNGLFIMTCATKGRLEHGTSRSFPQDSPLTIQTGWEYYKNLNEQDFYNAIPNFENMFHGYCFKEEQRIKFLNDLYFVGRVWKAWV